MAVPKRRRSKARKRTHKSLWKISIPTTTKCSNCGALRLTHNACTECGFYKGKQVIQVKVKKTSEEDK